MEFWLECRMLRWLSSGCVDSVVSVSSPRTTCANASRAQCVRRRPLRNTKEEDRSVMLSRYIDVGARVVRLGAQRGSWRSTAGMHLLRKLAGHHEPGRLPAIAHGAVLRSRAESSRGARDGVVAGAVAAGGGHCFWRFVFGAVCLLFGGFGLEKAFFPFKPLTPQTPSGKRTHKSPTAGRFPIPAPRPSSSENALRERDRYCDKRPGSGPPRGEGRPGKRSVHRP